MRSIFQLCLLLLMLLGAGNRVWGKVAAAENIAVRGFAESGVFCSGADAPPALMSSGEMAAWGYEPALDVRDGPNLYAYVRQNPWTAFDPDGLALDTIWDIGCLVYDAGCIIKNGAESAYGLAATGYHKATGNQGAADTAWNGMKADGRELGAAVVDGVCDLAATAVPGVPAGLQRAARTGAKVYDKYQKVETVADVSAAVKEGDYTGAVLELAEGASPTGNKSGSPTASMRPPAKRLPQDVKVNPTPPAALPTNRPVGKSVTQNQAAQADVQRMQEGGYTDIRVNQQQVNAQGERVGTNRPDIQGTSPAGKREYTEYDTSGSNRGPGHEERIRANDGSGTVDLRKVD